MKTNTENAKQSLMVRAFLNFPPEVLPRAEFEAPPRAEATGPWAILREHARTGEPIADLCGTSIRIAADRTGWREGIVVK